MKEPEHIACHRIKLAAFQLLAYDMYFLDWACVRKADGFLQFSMGDSQDSTGAGTLSSHGSRLAAQQPMHRIATLHFRPS